MPKLLDPSNTLSDWVRDHHEFVYRVAFSLLGNAADAEDAAQATFSSLATRAALPRPDSTRAYLARAVLNQSKNLIRRESIRRRHEDAHGEILRQQPTSQPDPRETMESMDDREAVATAVDQLPDLLRLPLVLHYREGLKYREVARALECPPGTVAKRISEAKNRLRTRFARTGLAGGAFVANGGDSILAQLPMPAIPAGLENRILSHVDFHAATATSGSLDASGQAAASASATGSKSAAAIWGTSIILAALVLLALNQVLDPTGSGPSEDSGSVIAANSDAPQVDSAAAQTFTGLASAEPPTSVSIGVAGSSESPAIIDSAETATFRVTVTHNGQPITRAQVLFEREGTGEFIARGNKIDGAPGIYEVTIPRENPARSKSRPVPTRRGSGQTDSGQTDDGQLEFDLGDGRTVTLPLPGVPVEGVSVEGVSVEGVSTRPSPTRDSQSTPQSQGTTPTPPSVDWTRSRGSSAYQTMQTGIRGWQLVVSAPGFLTSTLKLYTYPNNRAKSMEITLERPAPRFGVVVGPTGIVSGAQLQIVGRIFDDSQSSEPHWRRPPIAVQRGLRTESDSTGSFMFDALPMGDYWVEVTANGYQTNSFRLAAADLTNTLALESEAPLRVRAIDGVSDLPISGARVQLRRRDQNVATVTTDADGWARVLGASPGEYDLWITQPNLMLPAHEQPLTLTEEPTTLECRVNGGRVSGTLTLDPELEQHTLSIYLTGVQPDGAPRSSASAAISLYRVGVSRTFAFDRIAAGDYALTVHTSRGKGMGSWLDLQRRFTVKDGSEVAFDFEITVPTSGFEVRPTGPDGRPIDARARFVLQPLDRYAGDMRLKDGEPRAAAVPEGQYALIATAKGFMPVELELDLRTDEVRNIDVRFDRPRPESLDPVAFIPVGARLELWNPVPHSDVITMLRNVLPDVDIRVDSNLEASGLLDVRTVGPYSEDARNVLRNLFNQVDYKLDVQGTVIWIRPSR